MSDTGNDKALPTDEVVNTSWKDGVKNEDFAHISNGQYPLDGKQAVPVHVAGRFGILGFAVGRQEGA